MYIQIIVYGFMAWIQPFEWTAEHYTLNLIGCMRWLVRQASVGGERPL